jgi:hypothetical protein
MQTPGGLTTTKEFSHLCGLAFKKSRVTYKPLINHTTHGEATTNTGNAQRSGPNPSGNTRAVNGWGEEEIPTAEDERVDPAHSPYVAAVDGCWRNGRRCIFV